MNTNAPAVQPRQTGTGQPPTPSSSAIISWSEHSGWRFKEEWQKATFGRRLRAARKALNWSQERIAQQILLVAKQHDCESASVSSLRFKISNYERDVQSPYPLSLHLLADALGLDVNAFGLSIDPDFHWPPPQRPRHLGKVVGGGN